MKTTIHIKTLLVGALFVGFTACAEEEIPQAATELAGQLHIGSVKIGDAQKASRAIAEGATNASESFPYNQVITGFSNDDKLNLTYSFKQGEEGISVEATYNGSAWSLGENTAIKPTNDGDKWENLSVTASFLLTADTKGYASVPDEVTGFTQGQVDTRVYYDKLEASTTITEGSAGHISAVTDLKSNDLGKLTVNFRHAHALLRLHNTEDKIKINSIHEGTLISGKDKLAALWAEFAPTTATQEGESQSSTSIFVPLTSVTIGNNEYLQAIVPADYQLNSFKAVLSKGEGHITIEIPLTTPKELNANNQYNLSLDITNGAKVEFEKSDKPGWGDDVTLQQSHVNNLKYVEENGQQKFVVSSVTGLQELNKWMNEKGGDNVKYIEGYEDVDQTASRLSHDIHIAGDINLPSPEESGFDLDGTDGNKMSNWIPLGTSDKPYTGTITAADDAEITGLEIHVNTNNGGFVGYLGEEGKIEGLKLQGNFSATNATNFGAVAGYTNGGTISGCVVGDQNASDDDQTKVTGTINDSSSKSYIGGVVGWNNTGLIENCINYATVSAPDYQMVGGVLGENHRLDNCVIKDCKNYGTVTGLQHVGGVVGINHRVVNNCHNEGTVKGKTHVGGVVGMSNDYSPVPDGNGKPGWPIYVINATNKGAVSGEQCVGGVVGSNGSRSTSGGYIVASWNAGDISYAANTETGEVAGTYSAFGGVVGVNYHHAYTDEDDSKESWTDETKAREGNRTSHVIACYNTGSITTEGATEPKVGGVVGINEAGSKVWASYYSNPTQADEGCGEELNTETTGKDYSYVTDWTTAITAINSMNEAISKYKNGNDGGYGIVEGPSNSEFTGITTTVKIYVAGTGAPQLSETATGN